MSLKQKVLHSFKWSILGEIFSKLISPLVFVILAKILLPEDFGVVAAATIVTSFSQVFWDAGLSKALIQRKKKVEESATIVFWANLALSLLLYLLLFIFADYIAYFFQDSRLGSVIRILGLQLPLAASCSVYIALQQRNFQFKRLFWVRIFTTATPVLASIPLALYGMGYWALIAGTLVGQVAQAITLWKLSEWRPSFWFDRVLALELFGFGRWVMLSALLAWLFAWLDALVVGGYLGTHSLGLYRTGNALVTLIFGLVAGPILPVLYSLFSRMSNDTEKLRELVVFIEHIVMALVIPLGIGLFVLKDIIPTLIFTDNWNGIGEIIGVIGITQAISYTVSVKQEIYRSIGKPAVETKIMIISMIIRIPFYLVSIQYGIVAFVWARFASTLLGVANHLFFAKSTFQMRYRDYFKALSTTLIAGAIMYLVGHASTHLLGENVGIVMQTVIVIFACLITYSTLIFLLDSSFIRRAFAILSGREKWLQRETNN